MWTTLTLVAALSLAPQQAGGLTLTNARTSYGVPGITRADSKLLPGDQYFLDFDVEGITIDAAGKVLYSMSTELTDAKGKLLFKQEPRDLETLAALGGKSIPAYVQLDVGLNQPPGEYSCKVTVTDRASKRSGSLTRSITVLPEGLGFVRLHTTADHDGRANISQFETGGSLWVNTGVVGFSRDKAKGQPDLTLELSILDESGKPTLAKPFLGQINEKVQPNAGFLPVQFLVSLNRPGKFTVVLKATDTVAKKSTSLSFPITVADPK